MQRDLERRAQAAAAAGPNGVRHWFSSRVPETWRTCAEMLPAQAIHPCATFSRCSAR